ncbi:MAG: AHH domain-containing protein [Planctomycetaceae bacterium]
MRDAMQSAGTGKIAHHLIPLEAITKHRALLDKAAKGGFNINGKNNGILLRQAINHIDNHPIYNRDVIRHLDSVPKNLNPTDTARMLQNAADKLRKAIEDGTYGPWG